MKHGITPSFMAKPWGNVSISFRMVDHPTYAIALVCSVTWMLCVCANCIALHPQLANSKFAPRSHLHVSIRDGNGDNIFAIKPEELKGGREGAAYDELKY